MPEPLSPFRRLVIAEPGTVRIEVHRINESSLWTVIDEEDWGRASRRKWSADIREHTTYARSGPLGLHRLLLNAPEGVEVDHADGDGLNNRKSNLRLATRTQNLQNRRSHRARNGIPTTSKFKGVCWSSQRCVWIAYITVDGKREWLGVFPTDIEGARAYDRRAREAFGPFALLNFPGEAAP